MRAFILLIISICCIYLFECHIADEKRIEAMELRWSHADTRSANCINSGGFTVNMDEGQYVPLLVRNREDCR